MDRPQSPEQVLAILMQRRIDALDRDIDAVTAELRAREIQLGELIAARARVIASLDAVK